MELTKHGTAFFLILIILIIIGIFFIFSQEHIFLFEKENKGVFSPASVTETLPVTITDNTEPQKSIVQPPEIIKAIYLTSWSAATETRVEKAIEIVKTTEINAVVVDIKDWSGFIAYNTDVPEAAKYGAERILIPDIEALLERFHKEGIYVIARITVFQDPVLASVRPDLAVYKKSNKSCLWLDKSGLAWIDPAAKEVWDYNIAIAEDAANQGFDELNFDYTRFPSDGNLQDMGFPLWDRTSPRSSIIKEFYKCLREKLPQAILSIDLFGLSTVSSNDLGIGQVIEDAFEYFDFVCPMVYPSHYAEGFLGYQNPAEYPYKVVKYSMENALKKLLVLEQSQEKSLKTKLRPWLQDFNLGAIYDEKMIKFEIDAVSDALGDNFSGFMLWNSTNNYTIGALRPE